MTCSGPSCSYLDHYIRSAQGTAACTTCSANCTEMPPSAFLGLVTLCAMLSCVPAATLSDCDSFLAGLFPSLYPHCASNACKYGPWSDWFYTGKSRTETACTSGNAGLHNRTRNATGSGGQCERPVEYESKYVCKSAWL